MWPFTMVRLSLAVGMAKDDHVFVSSQKPLCRLGHEALVVGYDSYGVRIQNSWGTRWGATCCRIRMRLSLPGPARSTARRNRRRD